MDLKSNESGMEGERHALRRRGYGDGSDGATSCETGNPQKRQRETMSKPRREAALPSLGFLNFWPPKLRGNILLFQATRFLVLCYSSHRQGYRPRIHFPSHSLGRLSRESPEAPGVRHYASPRLGGRRETLALQRKSS